MRMLTWPARLHDGTFIFVFIHIKTEVFSKFYRKQRQVCTLVVFFVYICQHLSISNFDCSGISSAKALCEYVCTESNEKFRLLNTISPNDYFFQHGGVLQESFYEQNVLVAQRDTRMLNSKTSHVTRTVSRMRTSHSVSMAILDCKVLLQPTMPPDLLSLVQNRNQHHFYRLVAVFVVDNNNNICWLDTENHNHIATMQMCACTAKKWIVCMHGIAFDGTYQFQYHHYTHGTNSCIRTL